LWFADNDDFLNFNLTLLQASASLHNIDSQLSRLATGLRSQNDRIDQLLNGELDLLLIFM